MQPVGQTRFYTTLTDATIFWRIVFILRLLVAAPAND
jgi:hypothetical protein